MEFSRDLHSSDLSRAPPQSLELLTESLRYTLQVLILFRYFPGRGGPERTSLSCDVTAEYGVELGGRAKTDLSEALHDKRHGV